MRAGLGPDELQRGADGVCRGVGSAAEQGVGHAHLHEHRAEVVSLLQQLAALFGRHLALAKSDHRIDHLVHLIVGQRVDDLQAFDIEAALRGRGLDLFHVADEHRGEEAVLLQAGSRLKNAGIRTLGEHDAAGIGFQNVDQFVKHGENLRKKQIF